MLALVAAQRLAEMLWAGHNTRRLLAQGAREVGRRHYPLFIALHAAWLSAILATTPFDRSPDWALLGLFGLLQFGRLWVIWTLGRFWTTRIVTLDAMPLVRFGPYRLARHPNYWIVAAEIAVLPLAFGNWTVAVVFSVLNAALLRHRIRIEDAALAGRA
ncbi:membrane protein [Allostella sp. ATCC 35155]|nr:membrane protein [Stella sp. ATCC 35155]